MLFQNGTSNEFTNEKLYGTEAVLSFSYINQFIYQPSNAPLRIRERKCGVFWLNSRTHSVVMGQSLGALLFSFFYKSFLNLLDDQISISHGDVVAISLRYDFRLDCCVYSSSLGSLSRLTISVSVSISVFDSMVVAAVCFCSLAFYHLLLIF